MNCVKNLGVVLIVSTACFGWAIDSSNGDDIVVKKTDGKISVLRNSRIVCDDCDPHKPCSEQLMTHIFSQLLNSSKSTAPVTHEHDVEQPAGKKGKLFTTPVKEVDQLLNIFY